MTITTKRTKELVQKFSREGKADTGCAEVQVALLTERINNLTPHFAEHKQDNHSRRGLIRMVNQRRKMLSYLKRNSLERYKALIQALGLRK